LILFIFFFIEDAKRTFVVQEQLTVQVLD